MAKKAAAHDLRKGFEGHLKQTEGHVQHHRIDMHLPI